MAAEGPKVIEVKEEKKEVMGKIVHSHSFIILRLFTRRMNGELR